MHVFSFGHRCTRIEAAITLGVMRWFLGFTSRSRVRCVQCLRRRPHARRCIRNTRPTQAGDLRSAPAGALFVDVAFDLRNSS